MESDAPLLELSRRIEDQDAGQGQGQGQGQRQGQGQGQGQEEQDEQGVEVESEVESDEDEHLDQEIGCGPLKCLCLQCFLVLNNSYLKSLTRTKQKMGEHANKRQKLSVDHEPVYTFFERCQWTKQLRQLDEQVALLTPQEKLPADKNLPCVQRYVAPVASSPTQATETARFKYVFPKFKTMVQACYTDALPPNGLLLKRPLGNMSARDRAQMRWRWP